MRIKLFVLSATLLAVGCASEIVGTQKVEKVEKFAKNDCVTAGATYYATFTEINGTCGKVPATTIRVPADGMIANEPGCTNSSSYNGCAVSLDTKCDNSTAVGNVLWNEDGSGGEGQITMTIDTGSDYCRSTYSVIYTRQGDDPPAPDGSAPVPDAGSDASEPTSCNPENNQTFCSRFNKKCGGFTQLDNCKELRVAECGDCPQSSACFEGACKAIPPNCSPEDDRSFCSRNGYNCGTHTASDNCGKQRTVQSCGSLRFNGGNGISIAGGVPLEISNDYAPKHIELWVNAAASFDANFLSLNSSSSFKEGTTFPLGVDFGLVSVGDIYTNITMPINTWTFIFAGFDGSQYYAGSIVNDNITRTYYAPTGDYGFRIYSSLPQGAPSNIGKDFVGQMNNIRIWSKPRSNTEILNHYHDCLTVPQPGLVRQWCAREGSGAVIYDSITGAASLLNDASWDTGSCQ